MLISEMHVSPVLSFIIQTSMELTLSEPNSQARTSRRRTSPMAIFGMQTSETLTSGKRETLPKSKLIPLLLTPQLYFLRP